MADEQITDQSDTETGDAPEPDDATDAAGGGEPEQESETFPRSYVEQLRAENRRYREPGKRADELARRLHTALVAATGRLADPDDLPYTDEYLDSPEALSSAIDSAASDRRHRSRRDAIQQ